MSEAITQAAAYDLIDRFLRNNLYDDDYAKYSEALEAISQPAPSPQPAVPVVSDERDTEIARLKAVISTLEEQQLRAVAAGLLRPAVEPMTDEQIEAAITKAVRERKLSWTGFRKDGQGAYTLPVLSPADYQAARAIEVAHGITAKAEGVNP